MRFFRSLNADIAFGEEALHDTQLLSAFLRLATG